jgi:hypothetical protein
MRLPDSAERALHRCPDGPGGGCAIDGLPGPDVFAAAANTTHVTAARRRDGREEYFWFARVPEERRGWGRNPERIIGPLSRAQFEAEVARRGLPEPVRLR